jgi:hypothetical protein
LKEQHVSKKLRQIIAIGGGKAMNADGRDLAGERCSEPPENTRLAENRLNFVVPWSDRER